MLGRESLSEVLASTEFDPEMPALDEVMPELLAQSGIEYLSKINGFVVQPANSLFHEGRLIYSDRDHFSSFGERLLGRSLLKKEPIQALFEGWVSEPKNELTR